MRNRFFTKYLLSEIIVIAMFFINTRKKRKIHSGGWILTFFSLSCALCVFFQTKIGSGKLMGPKGVSVDRNGHIIVVDNKSCCVFIFQPNGKLVSKFGNRGNSDKQFAGTYLGYIQELIQPSRAIWIIVNRSFLDRNWTWMVSQNYFDT